MNQSAPPPGVSQPLASYVIIGVCVVLFLLEILFGGLPLSLALWPPASPRFGPWQLVSYGFFHANITHIFVNMFGIWMFGTQVERALGRQRFLLFYMVCLVGAGLTQMVSQHIAGDIVPTIGASGAVFGLLLAFGVMWPNSRVMLIFPPIPMKAKWFVLLYGGLELYLGVAGTGSNVAHFAHLGGLFFGAGLMWRWGWRPGMTWRFR